MIKQVSKKMKEKLNKQIEEDKKTEKKSWCQQMSFHNQLENDRFLNLAQTR